ncbi:FAD/NAD(P)-binding domain-containing protein [Pleurotus eryngii]|uniref:Sulfide:quinone oxidoreductase, mitochondrial n=1 Tax=Pleurotus eryngii TaxID=5323 RepID=A0A9P6DKM7_PLEER|nr:FAD/NAD(P)-binding domain-containing protein [Pleurotus eryngii]
MLSTTRSSRRLQLCLTTLTRKMSSTTQKDKFKIVVVGAGTGGLTVANQLYDRFKAAGKALNKGDIAIVDAAEYHYYQPGWTLVGAGLKPKTDFRKPVASLIPNYISHITENVASFDPPRSAIATTSGRQLSYDALVVSAGLQINWNAVEGLPKALADPTSGVSSIFSYDTCDKAWKDIDALQSGRAIFTQPSGVMKCPGASQKIMWMAWDRYRTTSRADNVKVRYFTGNPGMFSVKKYSDALNTLRIERGVDGYFQHNLVAVDTANRKATFKKEDGSSIVVDYTLLHVTPPMGPLDVLKGSPISDAAGWVQVDNGTLQHANPEYSNIFALGDCSSLPTAKTAAAITAEAPVLTENLFSVMDTGKLSEARYDGYTSCPLLTGYGELMLTEFKYGFVPKESFSSFLGDQSKRSRLYYHFKKDLFPWAYWNAMVKGKWFGTNAFWRPSFRV